MKETIENYIAREFKANDITATARVRVHGVQGNTVLSYLVDIFIGGLHMYRMQIESRPPFNPRISTLPMVETKKLKLHIEIIDEALKEIAVRYF